MSYINKKPGKWTDLDIQCPMSSVQVDITVCQTHHNCFLPKNSVLPETLMFMSYRTYSTSFNFFGKINIYVKNVILYGKIETFFMYKVHLK